MLPSTGLEVESLAMGKVVGDGSEGPAGWVRGAVDGVEADLEPVEAQVRRPGPDGLPGLGREHRIALVLG
jgi:hypothetical protein